MSTKALYSGSFDPLTNGHMNIISRASSICDYLVVAVADNPNKKCMFDIKERIEMVRKSCEGITNVTVVSVTGLLANYVNDNNIDIVIRGLRDSKDFEYELQMAQYNADLYDNAETVFLMTAPELSYISSSGVREITAFRGDISNLVPEAVRDFILKKMEDK